MKFNEKLLELRKQKGWSQEEVGEKINVSRQTISKYESGLSTPEMDKLIELAKVFEISIDELVGKEKNTIIPEEKNKNKNVRKIIIKLLITILVLYIILFAYKCIRLTYFYLRANSFNEKNYIMVQNFEDENGNLSTSQVTKKVGDSILFETISYGDEKPSYIEYVKLKNKTAYELIYNKSEGKYTYRNRLDDFVSEEEIEDYFNNFISNNQIKNMTLSCIPNNFKSIVTQALNPFYVVSPFKNKIENYLINDDIKVRINLTNDGLIERYDMKSEYGNDLSMKFSYDYVQGHFENFDDTEPLETYKDIVIYE